MAYKMVNNLSAVKGASDKAIARALETIGGKAEGYARDLCPGRTGNLQNSITHQAVDDRTMAIGTNVYYAPFVELGTYKQTAKPYLRPAVENHMGENQRILENECRKG